MNVWALLGIFLLAYAAFVFYVALKKPPKVWDMAKIQLFRKTLGEKGTVIFFIVFGVIAAGFGIWLLIR